MLDVTNRITRNNLRFAYILLYPKDRQCVIGNDSATRKRFMKFLINITMYSLTQRKYLNNIKLTKHHGRHTELCCRIVFLLPTFSCFFS